MVMKTKNIYEKNSKKFEELEKYIDQEILNKNLNDTCNCTNINYVPISKHKNNIEVVNNKKKKSNIKLNKIYSLKNIYRKYRNLIKKSKIITIINIIIFILTIILIKKQNFVNKFTSILIKHEIFIKLRNIKNNIMHKY